MQHTTNNFKQNTAHIQKEIQVIQTLNQKNETNYDFSTKLLDDIMGQCSLI